MALSPLLSLILMILGNGFFLSFISLHFRALNLGEMQIGFAQSMYYLGMLLASLRSEPLIARVGHIRALTATCGLLSAATLGMYLVPESQWFWLRLLAGLCMGCFYVGIESWMLAALPPQQRGKAMAIYTLALYFALSLSQVILPYIEDSAALACIVSSLLVSLAVVPISVGKSRGPQGEEASVGSLEYFVRLAPLGIGACLISGLMLSSLYSFMPIFIAQRHFEAGTFMAVMILGGALLQIPFGKLSDRYDRRQVLLCLALAALGAALLLSLPASPQVFALLLFIFGGLIFAIYPVAMALGCELVEEKELIKITGVMLFAYGLGAVLGPLLTPILKPVTSNYLLVMLALYGLLLVGAVRFSPRAPQVKKITIPPS